MCKLYSCAVHTLEKMVPLRRVARLLRRAYRFPWSCGSQAGCAFTSTQQRLPASVSSLSALCLHTANSQLSQLSSLQTASQPFPCVIHGYQRSVHTDLPMNKGPQMHETHTSEDVHKLIVIQPEYKTGPIEKPYVPSSHKLEEAVALVEAVSGWEVKGQRVEAIRQVHSKYLFGTGKMEELKSDIRNLKDSITGVFINIPTLTPVQHRCLAETFNKEVFDRFGIVLQIFKERAHTKEAKLQVELAEIPYLRGKLFEELEHSGGFTHRRGGTGKMGGGGETSVMTMKETLNRRQKRIKSELEEIRSRHRSEREHRARHAGLPIVAVVGYTNAGKTTLIKRLTHDEHMSPEDKLFATLDATIHAGRLPCGLKVLYVDTIGFVSDLPHELVESFASTLEDVTSADVLVHLTDVSHPQYYAQKANVLKVLSQLNPKQQLLDNMVDVLNKTDKLNEKDDSLDGLYISATEGEGIPELQERIQQAVMVATNQRHWKIIIPADGPQLSWLHHTEQATVLEVNVKEKADPTKNSLEVLAVLSEATAGKFRTKFGDTVHLHDVERKF